MPKDDNKPFAKISIPILLSIIDSHVVDDSPLRVWLLIYGLSQNGTQGISISYSRIAKQINKSYQTICRAIYYLSNKGLLEVLPVYKNGKWGVNQLKCILNQEIQDKCNAYQDRQESKHNQGKTKRTKDHPPKIEKEIEPIIEQHSQSESSTSQEKNLALSTDDNYYKKIINININNHNVADCETFKTEQKKIEDEVICKEKELIEAREVFEVAKNKFLEHRDAPVSDPNLSFSLLQQNNLALARVELIESSIKFLQKKIDDGIAMSKIREKVNVEQDVVNNIAGNRQLSRGLMWWIRKKLHGYGLDPSSVPRILNEMVHSIRFGSFSIVKYSAIREPMPLMKSVNCCLKLIREGKWQSPASYQYGNVYA